jgi:hypothetical protein
MLNGIKNIVQSSLNTGSKITERDRFGLIAVHAFFLAEEHGSERSNWHDWQEAEREIDAVIETAK